MSFQAHADKPQQKTLSVLLSTNGKAPYDEMAPGDILATFNAAVLGQLLNITENFEIAPGLIEKWSWNFATQSYELKLKDGIKFHNGRPATSDDLEFALLRGFFSEKRSFYSIFLGTIEGIDKAKPGTQFKSGIVDGIKKIDKLTLKVKLSRPNPNFLFSLTNPYFSLVAKESLNADMISYKSAPVGAGSYKVAEAFKNGRTVLAPVSSSGKFSSITLDTLDKENLYDLTLQTPKNVIQYKAEHSVFPDSVWTVFFSNLHPLGRDLNFRKLVQSVVNRKELAKGLSGYAPALEMLPKHFWGREKIEDSFDLKKAASLLEKIDKTQLAKPLKVVIFYSGKTFDERTQTRLDRLQKQFAEVGIKVVFEPTSEKFISKETAETAVMKLSSRVTDIVDPLLMFASFKGDSPYTYERALPDQKFEELFKAASLANSQEDRLSSMQKLSAHLNDQALAVPLLESKMVWYTSERVKSVGHQPQPLALRIDNLEMKD